MTPLLWLLVSNYMVCRFQAAFSLGGFKGLHLVPQVSPCVFNFPGVKSPGVKSFPMCLLWVPSCCFRFGFCPLWFATCSPGPEEVPTGALQGEEWDPDPQARKPEWVHSSLKAR